MSKNRKKDNTIMKFLAGSIPDQVSYNVVYTDTDGTDYEASDGVIRSSSQALTLNSKEVHNFVKMVVAKNKTEVYRRLVVSGFRLSPDDLIYLACQAGAGDMTQLLMTSKASLTRVCPRV